MATASAKLRLSQPLMLLLLLFLAAFAARAAFPDTSYFFWDETIYLLHGGFFAGHGAGYSELFQRPPLLPLLLSPFAGLAGYELVSRLLVAFLNSFVVFPVYFLTREIFGKKSAFVAAAVVSVLPVHILNSRWVMTDALGAMLAFSAVAACLIGFQKRSSVLVYGGGVLAALAVLMKFTNLLVLALLLPLILVNLRARWKIILTCVLLFASILLPYIIFNVLSFGSPFYTFSRAFQVVAGQEHASLGFSAWLLWDSFGILLAFLAVGFVVSAFSLLRRKKQQQQEAVSNRGPLLFLLYCLSATLAYSFLIIGMGVVARPAGIEWEAARFLLLFSLFGIPLIGHGFVQSAGFVWQQVSLLGPYPAPLVRKLFPTKDQQPNFIPHSSAVVGLLISSRISACVVRFCGLTVAAIVIAAAVFSLYPQLTRAYTPAIAYEDGLREVTKELGTYIRTSSVPGFGCIGNCPPVAYYSGKEMSIYYSFAELLAANHEYVVVFDGDISRLPFSRVIVSESCSRSRCAYLLASS